VSCHIHFHTAQNLPLSKALPHHQNFTTDKVSFIISWQRNGVIYLTPSIQCTNVLKMSNDTLQITFYIHRRLQIFLMAYQLNFKTVSLCTVLLVFTFKNSLFHMQTARIRSVRYSEPTLSNSLYTIKQFLLTETQTVHWTVRTKILNAIQVGLCRWPC